MCGMMRWDGQPSNHTFWLLSKHGVSHCLATLRECQMKQMPRRFSSSHRELEKTTRTPSYYVDEDYPAGPEIQRLFPEWSNGRGSEIVESGDRCLRLALCTKVVHARNEWYMYLIVSLSYKCHLAGLMNAAIWWHCYRGGFACRSRTNTAFLPTTMCLSFNISNLL